MVARPFVVGHSWVSRLRDSEVLPSVFKFVAKPGRTFPSVSRVLLGLSTHPEADYVFIILGGNDCNSAGDTVEICAVQDSCREFAIICRNAFPNDKLIFFQVEERYNPATWEIDLAYKRKGNKFNKWLNKFEGKGCSDKH